MSYAQHVHYALRMRDHCALGLMSEADASLAVNREWHFMAKEHKALYGAINWWTTLCPVAKGIPGGPMEVDEVEVEGSGETVRETKEGEEETEETEETEAEIWMRTKCLKSIDEEDEKVEDD
jgi:hypothetical protein